jgi:hypothetical protein
MLTVNEMTTIAVEIDALHLRAQTSAEEAVAFAKQAGELLLKAKAKVGHGKFLAWISSHLQVSPRQCQRYMESAKGKVIPIGSLLSKYDMMSHLKTLQAKSQGIWKDGRWEPEPGYMYLFTDESSACWVLPAASGGIHVSRLYRGERLASKGFNRAYTVLSRVNDPDLTADFYIGTAWAPFSRSGIHDILITYGAKNLRETLVRGVPTTDRFERPFGEPSDDLWYWDEADTI